MFELHSVSPWSWRYISFYFLIVYFLCAEAFPNVSNCERLRPSHQSLLLPFNNGGILTEEINKIEEYRPAFIGFKGGSVSSADRYILYFYPKINDFYYFP